MTAVPGAAEQRRGQRYQVTLRVAFQFAGKRRKAISTNVSETGATIVCQTRLPPGALLVLVVEHSGQPEREDSALIAQVVWSGPAPFGGQDAFAAGLEVMLALDGSLTGISTISMRNIAVRSSPGTSPIQPASSSSSRTPAVPELYTIILFSSEETIECVCEPRHVCTKPTCLG